MCVCDGSGGDIFLRSIKFGENIRTVSWARELLLVVEGWRCGLIRPVPGER